MCWILIQLQLHSALTQPKCCLRIQSTQMLQRRVQGLEKEHPVGQRYFDLLCPPVMPPPVPDASSHLLHVLALWKRSQLSQQQLLFARATRLKSNQKLEDDPSRGEDSVSHQRLLLCRWDCLEEHLDSSLLRPQKLSLLEIIWKSRLDLNPLQWRTPSPVLIVSFRFSQCQLATELMSFMMGEIN